jgi:DNA repair exonuclease SbcCD ATPase subunit
MNRKRLEDKLKELDEKIAEVNKRMPAHSVKPPIMTELLALEDERDDIFNQLEALKQKKTGN